MNIIQKIKSKTRMFRRRMSDPKKFVKTDQDSGQVQLELLKMDGCVPSSKVVDIGCGCLHLGVPLMKYLDVGHFAGVDPNAWLREKAMKDPQVRQLVDEKQPKFLSGDDFDASPLNMEFDFVFAHSVLSHAAHWQLGQFLENAAKVLTPTGRVLASIRLAEGNNFGSAGSPDKQDTMDEQWVYPGVSFFKLETIEQVADKHGLKATYYPQYTEFYTKTKPNEFHDWMVFTRKEAS